MVANVAFMTGSYAFIITLMDAARRDGNLSRHVAHEPHWRHCICWPSRGDLCTNNSPAASTRKNASATMRSLQKCFVSARPGGRRGADHIDPAREDYREQVEVHQSDDEVHGRKVGIGDSE